MIDARFRRPLRLAVGIAVVAMIAVMLSSTDLREQIRSLNTVYVALAVAVQFAAKLVWAWRWQVLLRAVDMRRDFVDLLQLIHVGLFVNWFLPSFVGGDLARSHLTREGNAHAAYAVVVGERIIGFLTLLTIAIVGSIAAAALDSSKMAMFGPLAVILLAVLVGSCALPFLPLRRPALLTDRSARIARAASHLERFATELRKTLGLGRRYLWIGAALSYALHLLAIYFHLMCARSANVPVDFVDLLIVVPVSVFVAMLPVTINGLGLREGALVGMLALFGVAVPQAAVFAILTLLVSAMYALVGGIILVVRRDLAFAR